MQTARGLTLDHLKAKGIEVKPTNANMFICGPDVIKAATGQTVTMDEVGSATVHATVNGNIHFVADNDAHALQLALKMPWRLAPDQQFGQHRTAAPDAGTDVTLARQHPQQAQQLQVRSARRVRQCHAQWQLRSASDTGQLGQLHQRVSLWLRRAVKRASQRSSSELSVGWSR